jgi:hypothetical protein
MKSLEAGTIIDQNDSSRMKCLILDLSENGAKLKPTDVTLLPKTFHLMIADGPSYDCEEVRRTHDQIAVRFV